MTARNTWKSFERRVAKQLNAIRTPLSGMNSKHTAGDIIDDTFYVEIKLRATLNDFLKKEFLETITETEINAKQENKYWIIVFKEKNSKKEYAVLDFKLLAKIIEQSNRK